jgi:hypothetical protein
VAAALVASNGCVGPSQAEVPFGAWGGDHVEVLISEAGASFQFDCAHGRVDGRIPLAVDGGFRTDGFYTVEHGGPVREGDPELVYPAVYVGRLQGRRLTFRIQVPAGPGEIGPFTAIRGASPRVVRCL